MRIKYIKLFKAVNDNDSADVVLTKYLSGLILPDLVYNITSNYTPNKIRKSTLFDIPKTETSIVDINQISDEIYYNTTDDKLVSSVLYLLYEDQNPVPNNWAYMRYLDGHIELVFFVPESEDKSVTNNYVLLTLEDEDENLLISTAYNRTTISNSKMQSSSNKVARILINLGSKDSRDNPKLLPFSDYFKEVDRGILELTSHFSDRKNVACSSKKLFNFIDKNLFLVNYEPTDHKLKYRNSRIGKLTNIVST